jgi:hypothetical protein
MFQKLVLRMGSLIFVGIILCALFSEVVEAAEVNEQNDVEVYSRETEIIGSTLTDKWHNRKFHIDNGQLEIIYTIWGSNDDENWVFWDTGSIEPYQSTVHVMGINHYWYIKLTGRTTEQHVTPSIVDASLTYHLP